MEKKDLISLLDSLLLPLGFKRRGNNWSLNGDELSKLVNLQKSQYSNSFYVNYGYIINDLPLNKVAYHVNDRLSSYDKIENKEIIDLLDLENDLENDFRENTLKRYINREVVSKFISINTREDLADELRKRPYLYTIPPFVLDYLKVKH